MPDKIFEFVDGYKRKRRWDGLDIEICKNQAPGGKPIGRTCFWVALRTPMLIVTARAPRYNCYFPEGGQGEAQTAAGRYCDPRSAVIYRPVVRTRP